MTTLQALAQTTSPVSPTNRPDPTVWLTPTQAIQPEIAPLPTAIPVLAKTPQKPWSSFASLPPGQYVVYFDTESKNHGLDVISQNGAIRQYLTEVYGHSISIDGRRIAYAGEAGREFIFDMEYDTLVELPAFAPGCTAFNTSPDLSESVVSCHGEVYVVSHEDDRTIPITHLAHEQEYYSSPLWSPDGKWIALFNQTYPPDPFRTDPDDGLYLIDTACIAEPGTCPAKMRGPFQDNLYLQGPYVWSPDSQKLAIPVRSDDRPIKIFDLKTETFRDLNLNGGYGSTDSFAWSPDGEWIAYSRRESETDSSQDVFLAPVAGGGSVKLVDSPGSTSVYFWLTVPWPFRSGDTYAITEAGANLNLRQSPDLNANVLKKLQPEETVQIVEGPVEMDGYHWWKVRVVADGVEGWLAEHPDWFKSLVSP
ncbi:MAG: SH3 domain-containing protein [Chloroflexota bacterium]